MVAWSDLPSDLLTSVAARLELVDQIRFRAVCQSWQKIEEVKPNDKLPWIFSINEIALSEDRPRVKDEPHYYLYDAQNKKVYGILIHRESTVMSLRGFRSIHIIRLKSGWVLVNLKLEDTFLLFNPFTQEIVHLPELRIDFPCLFTFRYFSKSRRLIVYAAGCTKCGIVIKVWKSGDQVWESSNFVAEFPNLMETIVKVQPVGEILYCIFKTGVVGSFNERHKSWSLVVSKLFSVGPGFDIHCRTLEFRGELLTINFSTLRDIILWRLDQSKGCWVEVDEFCECAIFCSVTMSHSDLCSEEFIVDSNPAVLHFYFAENTCVSSMAYNLQRKHMSIRCPCHIQIDGVHWTHSTHWIEPCACYTTLYNEPGVEEGIDRLE